MKTIRSISLSGILLLVGMGLFPLSLTAQSWSVKHYNSDDGLPGNITYEVIQDKDGYMWICTDNGICRFDGKEFKTYTSPLIKNNEILKVKEMWGQIWFLSFGGNLFYIEDEIVHSFNPEGRLEGREVADMAEDPSGNLLIPVSKSKSEEYGVFVVKKAANKTGSSIKFFELSASLNLGGISWMASNKKLFLVTPNSIYEYENTVEAFRRIYYKKNREGGHSSLALNQMDLLATWGSGRYNLKYFIEYDNGVFSPIDLPKLSQYSFVKNVLQDSQSRFWINCANRVVLLDSSFQFIQDMNAVVNNQRVNELQEDREGNIWLSTNGAGLYLIQNSPFLQYNSSNSDLPTDYIYDLDGDEMGNVYLGSSQGWLTRMKGTEIISTTRVKNTQSEMYDVMVTSKDEILVTLDGVSSYQLQGNKLINLGENLYTPLENSKRISEDKKHGYSFSCGSYLSVHRDSFIANIASTSRDNTILKIYSTLFLEKNSILLGTNKGIYYKGNNGQKEISKEGTSIYNFYKKRNIEYAYYVSPVIQKHYFEDSLTIDYYISDIQRARDNTIWIATRSNGLYQVVDNAIVYHYLESETGITSNVCNRIFIDKNDQVWLATNKGLNRINPKQHSVRKITIDDGLSSNYVTSTYKHDSLVFVGTANGMTMFHENDLKNTKPAPLVVLRDLKINEKDTVLHEKYELLWDQNSLYIGFVAPYFQGNISYKYRMLGVVNKWISTEDNYVRFPELQTGKYTFEVKSQTGNGMQSKEIAQIQFHIKPHPLRSPLAYSLYVFSALGLMLLAFYLRVRQIRLKEAEKTKINKQFAELEMQALQAQMNPHFVFNAMNAIQNYIALKEVNQANKYLAEFGKLMRLFLESTRKKYIYIEEELELLRLYVRLEKLRFRDKITVHFELDENLETDVEIPTLLLQPFVENAINHGLAHKQGEGTLRIIINQLDAAVKVTIIDNGIGRKKANELKQKSLKPYKSMGMQIVDDRLATLNIIEGIEVNIQVFDLTNAKGEAAGTKVEILIPILD